MQPDMPETILKRAEHLVKDSFFRIFSWLLHHGDPDFATIDGHNIRSVLFIRPDKIGDLVISLPVFDALLERFPNIKISIVGTVTNRSLIDNDPRFEKTFCYKKSLLTDPGLLYRIRNERFEVVVDMINDDSVTGLFLSQIFAPSKPRIAVGKKKYHKFYDYNFKTSEDEQDHIIDVTLNLLRPFGIDPDTVSRFAPPYIDLTEQAIAADFVKTVKQNTQTMLVGYNLSAGRESRYWAPEKSVALVKRLIYSHDDLKMILICMPDDREIAQQVRRESDESKVHIVPPKLSIRTISGIISELNLLITPDTSLVHIARAHNVSVVGMYPRVVRNFKLWRPYDQEEGAVSSGSELNIFDITVDQMYSAFLELHQRGKLKTL